jgi:hypothetical protein
VDQIRKIPISFRLTDTIDSRFPQSIDRPALQTMDCQLPKSAPNQKMKRFGRTPSTDFASGAAENIA